MAASKSTAELHDYLECSICTNILNVPKTLPCLHSFCLKCLEQHVQYSGSGSPRQANCPTCRESFTVETVVDKAFRTNFFINNLIKMYELSSKKPQLVKCDACDKQILKDGHYCLVCKQVYCDDCKKAHTKVRATMSHRIKPLDKVKRESLNELSAPLFCDLHLSHPISLYCTSCTVKLCLICQVEVHQTHKCVSVEQKGEELKGQSEKSLVQIEKTYGNLLKDIKTLEVQQEEFNRQINETNREIEKREKMLIENVKEFSRQLKYELMTIKTRNMEDFDKLKQELNQSVVALKSVRETTRKLLDFGSSIDFIDAQQILKESLVKSKKQTLGITDKVPRISFKSADDDGWFTKNNFGTIQYSGAFIRKKTDISMEYTDQPKLLSVINGKGQVNGLTCLNNYLYVVRYNSSVIEVFDIKTFKPTNNINVTELSNPWDITSCEVNNCLYITDYNKARLYRVTSSGDVSLWTTDQSPYGVSVTNNYNVLVTFDRSLVEYTTEGQPIRKVVLSTEVTHCYHSLSLTDNRFIVGHGNYGDKLHRVCEVDVDGQLIKQFGSSPGNDNQQMCGVYHLSSDNNNNILVVDWFNHRILLLTSSLCYKQTIITEQQQGIEYPWRIYYNTTTGCLYVGLCNGEVKIFNIIK